LLSRYHHTNTEHGVCVMLNEYFEHKQPLIDMFEKSKTYIGDMRIVIDVELERTIDGRELRNFCNNFPADVNAEHVFLKFTDENGKTLQDYLKVGVGGFKAKDLRNIDLVTKLKACAENQGKFHADGCTKESYGKFIDFGDMICSFGYNPASTLNDELANCLTQAKINATFVRGMKTSRAFNRFCAAYGVDKLPNYNKLFAQYADMVSGLKRKMKFYISLNPLDYLTMSFGNSWASCHTIDKRNERRMPNDYEGMYCGGTMSYMLDSTSIITYVHNNATTDVEVGKIYRNMFHYNEGTLIQGRIYPQGNDGATDLYQTFREVVQEEFSKLLNLQNNSWIKRTCGCHDNALTCGVHYEDYFHYSGCNVSYPREMPLAGSHVVNIGSQRVCPKCGEYISDGYNRGRLVHDYCE